MLSDRQRMELLKLSLPKAAALDSKLPWANWLSLEEPLAPHTSLGVGGPADALYCHRDGCNFDPLKNILAFCATERLPITIMGGGTNVLISDHGLRGIVIKMDDSYWRIPDGDSKRNPVRLQVSAGCSMSVVVSLGSLWGLTGLEPFCGLPGTIGGAIYNNSHFQRSQLFGNLVTKVWSLPVHLVQPQNENFYRQAELSFSYDHSIFQEKNQAGFPELIIFAELELTKDSRGEIQERNQRYLKERRKKQPLNFRSAGCVFKNPSKEISAGWLIEQAGLKGFCQGGARVSEQHANFIINPNNLASAKDVTTLMERIKTAVHQKFGQELIEEIFFLDNGKQPPTLKGKSG